MHITPNRKVTVIAILILLLIAYLSIQPSNDRDWATDQQVLPYAEIDGDIAHIYNMRNFTYRTTSDYDVHYYNRTYNLSEIKAVYYIVEPFSDWQGSAHTFLSFEFENDIFVAISVEIRKEKGEEFSAVKGLFRQYELMYVFGDENDLVKLRSNFRKDTVFVYPVNTKKENIRKLFLGMMERANALKQKPEFYNTLTSTCTTNIMSHVNTISPKRIPFNIKVLAPGYSDELAYDLDLIKKNGTLEETRNTYKINEHAQKYADDPDFSLRIRGR